MVHSQLTNKCTKSYLYTFFYLHSKISSTCIQKIDKRFCYYLSIHMIKSNNWAFFGTSLVKTILTTKIFLFLQVLELQTGIPITLCILFATVAKLLGVVCKPVNAPKHFLLRWQHNDM